MHQSARCVRACCHQRRSPGRSCRYCNPGGWVSSWSCRTSVARWSCRSYRSCIARRSSGSCVSSWPNRSCVARRSRWSGSSCCAGWPCWSGGARWSGGSLHVERDCCDDVRLSCRAHVQGRGRRASLRLHVHVDQDAAVYRRERGGWHVQVVLVQRKRRGVDRSSAGVASARQGL